jgi:signal transduction histidine kinase/CheY-like chemotaxis protein
MGIHFKITLLISVVMVLFLGISWWGHLSLVAQASRNSITQNSESLSRPSVSSGSGTGGIVSAQQPLTEEPDIKGAHNGFALLLLAGTIVSVFFINFALQRIMHPLVLLNHAVLGLGRSFNEAPTGYDDARADLRDELLRVSRTKDEIGALAQAFVAMDRKHARVLSRLSVIAREWERTFDTVDDALFIVDGSQQIVRLNRAASIMIGASFQEILGRNLAEVLFGSAASPFENLPTDGPVKPIASSNLMVEGDYEIVGTLLEGGQGEESGSIFVVSNVTQRKALEKHVRVSSKMEAVGLMAGGVAHNFNNSLAIILGNVEMSLRKLPVGSDVIGKLDSAKTAILRARDLVQQILIYSGNGPDDKTSINLAMVVEETLNLLRTTLPSTVNLQQNLDIGSRDLVIRADSARLQGVLINLCNNAVFAMDEKGDLTICLDAVELGERDVSGRYGLTPGSYVKLSVTDTGSGMSAETMEKIFDPFFTTKKINEGTGMGLSTVKGIVEQYGGLINVGSTPGRGSSFDLYFPVVDMQLLEKSSISQVLPGGNERILFLDDEEMLVGLGENMFSEMGYHVISVTSSIEALEMFRADPNRFDLVITDQTMPDLSGRELIRELLKIRPDLPTILCTGFSNKITEAEAQNMGIKAFCMKPLEISEIAHVVRRVLDEAAG